MLKLTVIITLLFSFSNFSLAGGAGGGGGVRPTLELMSTSPRSDLLKARIIFGRASSTSTTRISIGNVEANQWKIQEFEVSNEVLMNSDLAQEIQSSIELNNWVEIKK